MVRWRNRQTGWNVNERLYRYGCSDKDGDPEMMSAMCKLQPMFGASVRVRKAAGQVHDVLQNANLGRAYLWLSISKALTKVCELPQDQDRSWAKPLTVQWTGADVTRTPHTFVD